MSGAATCMTLNRQRKKSHLNRHPVLAETLVSTVLAVYAVLLF